MEDIKIIIDRLLKQPIAHFLGDSGGAYGYRYEKNQENGYLTGLNAVEEYTDKEAGERTLEVTIPVYDFLTYNLMKDETVIGLEEQLYRELELNDINCWGIWEVQDFLNNGLFTGMHIENKVEWINTYNYEEYVSQTLQFALISNGYDWFVLLEVHNGCDVRSGYTKPQLFRVKDKDCFLSGLSNRKCECKCGLNDYTFYGTDDAVDSCGDYVYKDEIFNRTYLDTKGNVRCRECDGVVKGGFIEW